jgi:tRNA modification GTPase
VRDGRAGRVVRDGSLVVIAGRPNAGKSSLFNALVGAARAIVTDVPGTTRDLVTERIDLDGVPVTLVDTAGLREVTDAIEAEGVRRAREAQAVAALTVVVIDGSEPLGTIERAEISADRRLVVMSKSDLPRQWTTGALGLPAADLVEVSVVTREGLDRLRRRIVLSLTSRENWRDPPAVSNIRHLGHLTDALAVVERAEAALRSGATEELLLAELWEARQALEEVTGRRAPEDLLPISLDDSASANRVRRQARGSVRVSCAGWIGTGLPERGAGNAPPEGCPEPSCAEHEVHRTAADASS